MKKILSVLLAVCLLVGALPMTASAIGETSGTCGDNVTWSFDTGSKTLTISGSGPMGEYFWSVRPWNDFKDEIQTVVIQPGVTSISSSAFFSCVNLTSVKIPDSVTKIDICAFFDCIKLPSVAIPDSVTSIGLGAFGGCTGLTSVKISNSVTDIGGSAFHGCTNLTSVTIPDSMGYIGGWMFTGCTGLTSVKIPDSVVYIYNSAFGGCTGLTSITIPNSVTEIWENAFAKCTGLTSVTIPDSVTEIWDYAFSGCTGLTAITIPDSVTAMGSTTFANCKNLTIYGVAGSYAESFAKENNIPFVAGKAPDEPVKPAKPTQFSDVPAGAYYADAVKWAVENGITAGTDKTHFSPNKPCTRAQAVTFLWRAAGKPEPTNTATAFTDVEAGSYYEKAVRWAVENGVTNGTTGTTFGPGDTCSRAQIVTFLWRAENKPAATGGSSFGDVSSTAYYAEAVKWAVANNITKGTSGTAFSPAKNCVRGQIVTFLYRDQVK